MVLCWWGCVDGAVLMVLCWWWWLMVMCWWWWLMVMCWWWWLMVMCWWWWLMVLWWWWWLMVLWWWCCVDGVVLMAMGWWWCVDGDGWWWCVDGDGWCWCVDGVVLMVLCSWCVGGGRPRRRRRRREAGWSKKNKNPTWQCGEIWLTDWPSRSPWVMVKFLVIWPTTFLIAGFRPRFDTYPTWSPHFVPMIFPRLLVESSILSRNGELAPVARPESQGLRPPARSQMWSARHVIQQGIMPWTIGNVRHESDEYWMLMDPCFIFHGIWEQMIVTSKSHQHINGPHQNDCGSCGLNCAFQLGGI